jgi:hypothetical protein
LKEILHDILGNFVHETKPVSTEPSESKGVTITVTHVEDLCLSGTTIISDSEQTR